MLRLPDVHRLMLIGTVTFCSALLQVPTVVYACPPPPEDYVPASVLERARESDIVLVGTVITTTTDASLAPTTATVQRSEAIKGDAPATLDITGFAGHTHECISFVRPGETWIFFVDHRASVYEAHHTYRFDAVAQVSESNLTEARIGASGMEPIFLPIVTWMH